MNNWLNANKIFLNVSKTEAVRFKSWKKQTDSDLHLKLNEKLHPTDSIKYLRIKIDENLTYHQQINNVAVKVYNTILSECLKYDILWILKHLQSPDNNPAYHAWI